jgi:hypothetical protein
MLPTKKVAYIFYRDHHDDSMEPTAKDTRPCLVNFKVGLVVYEDDLWIRLADEVLDVGDSYEKWTLAAIAKADILKRVDLEWKE